MANERNPALRSRRFVLRAAVASALAALAPRTLAQGAEVVIVYKNPTCGCCGEWVKHMQANGFRVAVREVGDTSPMRRRYGVPGALASCHTAVVGGYAIEGHVPAADVKRLLRERPKLLGLSVPGMAASAPGMDQQPPQPYETLAFDSRRYRVFARH